MSQVPDVVSRNILAMLGITGDMPNSNVRPNTPVALGSVKERAEKDATVRAQLERLEGCRGELLTLSRCPVISLRAMAESNLFDCRTNLTLAGGLENIHLDRIARCDVDSLLPMRFRELEKKAKVGYVGWTRIYTTLNVFDATDRFRAIHYRLNDVLQRSFGTSSAYQPGQP